MQPIVSVILPAYNEAENIEPCVKGVTEALSQYAGQFEVVVVDDGSTDETGQRIRKLATDTPSVVLVTHGHNLGKTQAIISGLAKSTGKIVVLMDADLQYDPNDIPKLVNRIEEGYAAVNGRRIERKDGFSKRLPSKIFNSMARFTFDLDVKDFNSGLKAFRREVLQGVDLRGDYHRYILAAVKANGYNVSEVPINHFARIHGQSKYGINRVLLGSSDLVSLKLETALSKRPMLLFGGLSALCLILGVAAGVYSIFTGGIALRPSLLLSVGFVLASIQFLAIGFLADLLVSMRNHSRQNSRAC